MQTVTTIGLDIAKSVFQVHAVDAAGKVIIRRQLKRRYVLSPGPICGSSRPRPLTSRAAWYFIARAISACASRHQ